MRVLIAFPKMENSTTRSSRTLRLVLNGYGSKSKNLIIILAAIFVAFAALSKGLRGSQIFFKTFPSEDFAEVQVAIFYVFFPQRMTYTSETSFGFTIKLCCVK